jgi:hypothetical protein
MIKVIELYNDLTQQFEDWVFRHVVPPVLKIIEIALKLTLFYSFYLLIANTINELF